MKKVWLIIGGSIVLLAAFYIFGPYTIKTVCFGDVCPDNGGTFLLYKHQYTEEECTAKGGRVIAGYGWVRVYAGCSPI